MSRAIILVKSAGKEIHRLLHPRSIRRVTVDHKPVPDSVVHGTMVFFALYVGIIMLSVLLVAWIIWTLPAPSPRYWLASATSVPA